MDKSLPPLILVGIGYQSWQILGPSYSFGEELAITGSAKQQDRRYEELARVTGSLDVATRRLHQLERGR